MSDPQTRGLSSGPGTGMVQQGGGLVVARSCSIQNVDWTGMGETAPTHPHTHTHTHTQLCLSRQDLSQVWGKRHTRGRARGQILCTHSTIFARTKRTRRQNERKDEHTHARTYTHKKVWATYTHIPTPSPPREGRELLTSRNNRVIHCYASLTPPAPSPRFHSSALCFPPEQAYSAASYCLLVI